MTSTRALTPAATDVLVVVDVQNDFCPGGSLATDDGAAIVPTVNALARRFDNVVLTADWHPHDHVSFASTHGREPFTSIDTPYGPQMLWPDHCVRGTAGAEFHPDLDVPHAQLVFRKGYLSEVDSYSAFVMQDGATRTGLAGYLHERGIRRIFAVGIAVDYCVGGLALDALANGFETYVIADAVASIDAEGTAVQTWADLAAAGVHRITAADLMR